MKRSVRGAVVAVVGGLVAAAASPACVEYPQSIVVTKMVVLSPDDERCVINPDDLGLVSGAIDVAVADAYTGSLVVKNQLNVQADPGRNRVETASVYLLGASVRLTLQNGTALDGAPLRTGNEFRTLGTGFVAPTQTSAISVTLLDLAAVNALRARLNERKAKGEAAPVEVILAFARVQGESAGGLSVESQEFQFPITVCSKCLVDFVRDPADPTSVCKIPPVSTASAATTRKKVCNPGQDSRVRCDECESPYCKTGN